MVNNNSSNGIESTVLKAKYGADIRKSQLHHTQDLNFNDLVLMMQRVFQIKSSASIGLKYRDSEGDWITLANDDDVVFALQHEPSLYVEVSNSEGDRVSHPLSPITTTDSLVASARNSVKEETDQQHACTPQRQLPSMGQMDTTTPLTSQSYSEQQHKEQPQQNFGIGAIAPPTSNQSFQQEASSLPVSQESHYQNFNQQPAPYSESGDSVHREVNLSASGYGTNQLGESGGQQGQRAPSIQPSGGQLGAYTSPVNQDYNFQPGHQPPSHQPAYSMGGNMGNGGNELYSAPPTIHPSVQKEVNVPSAYAGYPTPQPNTQQHPAPPPSITPMAVGGYGAPTPPISQYNPIHSGGQGQYTGYGGPTSQPMAPPPNQTQPPQGFGGPMPPPVSSVVGGPPTGNPFSRGPNPGGFNRPTNAYGNHY